MDGIEVFVVPADSIELSVPYDEPCSFIAPPDNEPVLVTRGDNVAPA